MKCSKPRFAFLPWMDKHLILFLGCLSMWVMATPMTSAAAPTPGAMTSAAPAGVQLGISATPIPQSLQPLAGLRLTTTTSQAGAINTRSQPVWASFADGSSLYGSPAGDSRLLGVALDPSLATTNPSPLPIVVYGFTTNPNDATDVAGYVARFSLDGTMVTAATLDLGTGNRVEIHGAAVDPNDGSVYIAGQATLSGVVTDLVDHLSADLSTEVWNSPVGHVVQNEGHANSVILDSTGTYLYVTGDLDGNVSAAQLTSLSSVAPTDLLDFSYPFQDSNGNSVPSAGNGVAVDSQGNVNLATSFTAGTDTLPGVLQLDPTFAVSSGGNWLGGPLLVGSTGPNGTMNSIYVDSSDNIYVTGGVSDPTTATLDDVFVGSYDSSGNSRLVDNAGNPAAGFYIPFVNNSQQAVQTIGYGIQTDASGNVFFGVAAQDPNANNAGNMSFVSVDPTFSNYVNAPGLDTGDGTASGSNDDELRGIALDTTDNILFLAGFTSSSDFKFTTGEAQSTFAAGPYDGIVVAYTLP
jgi:hypothetical protein